MTEAFEREAALIGVGPNDVNQISWHSIRVGATLDLLALNIDLASVMQAGRWKTNRMPMRYGEYVLAARSAVARPRRDQCRRGDCANAREGQRDANANNAPGNRADHHTVRRPRSRSDMAANLSATRSANRQSAAASSCRSSNPESRCRAATSNAAIELIARRY